MKHHILKFIYFISVSVMLISCENNSEENMIDPLDGLTKLKEGYVIGASAKVEIWGKKNFFVGYNNLVIVLYDSLNLKEKISDAHIHLMPLMTMEMGTVDMQNACPVENPDENSINDVFPAAIAFIMPSSADDSWKLGVEVHNHQYGGEGEAEFDISVDNPTTSVLSVFTSLGADKSNLVLSLVQPTAPKVGLNDIEFTIHKGTDMMNFAADDSYTIEITPEMPGMGHGSPNNVNPVNLGNGHYKGKVNFTTTGEWKINVFVKKDGNLVSKDIYFNIAL